jgi:hypothetical protein
VLDSAGTGATTEAPPPPPPPTREGGTAAGLSGVEPPSTRPPSPRLVPAPSCVAQTVGCGPFSLAMDGPLREGRVLGGTRSTQTRLACLSFRIRVEHGITTAVRSGPRLIRCRRPTAAAAGFAGRPRDGRRGVLTLLRLTVSYPSAYLPYLFVRRFVRVPRTRRRRRATAPGRRGVFGISRSIVVATVDLCVVVTLPLMLAGPSLQERLLLLSRKRHRHSIGDGATPRPSPG